MRFIDTNVFLYVMRKDPLYGETALKILERVEAGEEASTSTLVVEEACAYIIAHDESEGWDWKTKMPSFLQAIHSYPTLRKEGYAFPDMLTAISYLKTYNIDWNDCIILAQMKRLGYSEIYSNDRDFDKVEWVTRIFE